MGASSSRPHQALIVRYGLHDRSRGCAWQTQERHFLRELERMGLKVRVAELTFEPLHSARVDNATYKPDISTCRFDYCERIAEHSIDMHVQELCGRFNCRTLFDNYDAMATSFALRQLYSEYRVAKYLSFHAHDVDFAIAVTEDLALLAPVTQADLDTVMTRKLILLTSEAFDWGGVTDGLYVGRPATLACAMGTFGALGRQANYSGLPFEKLLARWYRDQRLTRRALARHGGEEVAGTEWPGFLKLRHSGLLKAPGDFDFGCTSKLRVAPVPASECCATLPPSCAAAMTTDPSNVLARAARSFPPCMTTQTSSSSAYANAWHEMLSPKSSVQQPLSTTAAQRSHARSTTS